MNDNEQQEPTLDEIEQAPEFQQVLAEALRRALTEPRGRVLRTRDEVEAWLNSI